MLAVRLHTDKNPGLKMGAHLTPILDWETDKMIVKRWVSQLNQGGGKQVTKVQFASLIAIPDDHPVFLSLSPFAKTLGKIEYIPWCEIPVENKEQFIAWQKSFIKGGAVAVTELPELIIGAPLLEKHVKWTKNVRLLYFRETNVKRRKNRGA